MDISTRFDVAEYRGDYVVSAGALLPDAGLQTAVLISLFTDRRAEEDDALPDRSASRRGWWGDALSGRRIGSRLWLLSREKQLREAVNRAREYAREALAWLVEDGVALRVTVEASVVRDGMLGLFVEIERNQSAPARFRFELAWKETRN